MTKIISIILVALLAVACAGEPFTDGTLVPVIADAGAANEAGASDVAPSAGTGAGAGAGAGGSRSSGGASAQVGGSGGAAAGTGSAGATAAAGSVASAGAPSCEFDVTKITAALPKSLVWKDYMYTEGQLCTTCRNSPCDTINVISWGTPQVSDGRLQYQPNTDQPMVSMSFGANDGSCTRELECGVKFGSNMQLVIEVVQVDGVWEISTSEMSVTILATAACKNMAGEVVRSIPMGADFGGEVDAALVGLKIPCN